MTDREPHIRCGCGAWFDEFEAYQRHRNQPGHVDRGAMFVPQEADR